MTGSETGSRHPARRVEPPPWAGLRRLGLTVRVVLAATALLATAHLVGSGAVPGPIGLGIAGAEPRRVPRRRIEGVRHPRASCDSGYCPALR